MQQNFPLSTAGTEQAAAASTTSLAVTGVAQQFILPLRPNTGASIRLANIGTQVVFFLFGNQAVTTSGTAMGVPLLPNTVEVFSLPPGVSQISAIAAATGSTLYATCGEGM